VLDNKIENQAFGFIKASIEGGPNQIPEINTG